MMVEDYFVSVKVKVAILDLNLLKEFVSLTWKYSWSDKLNWMLSDFKQNATHSVYHAIWEVFAKFVNWDSYWTNKQVSANTVMVVRLVIQMMLKNVLHASLLKF